MKNRLLKLLFLLIFSCSMLVACSGQAKELKSFAPSPTAEVGDFFEVDSSNLIKINSGRIEEDGNRRILIINYSWKNEGSKADTTFDNFKITASQSGVSLEPNLEFVEDKKKLVIPVAIGETLDNIEQAFILVSEESVNLSVLGSDPAFIVDKKPISSYPIKVEININDLK